MGTCFRRPARILTFSKRSWPARTENGAPKSAASVVGKQSVVGNQTFCKCFDHAAAASFPSFKRGTMTGRRSGQGWSRGSERTSPPRITRARITRARMTSPPRITRARITRARITRPVPGGDRNRRPRRHAWGRWQPLARVGVPPFSPRWACCSATRADRSNTAYRRSSAPS